VSESGVHQYFQVGCITTHLKKMILYASGGPAGGQPFEKVAKHAFFCLSGFLMLANNKWR
jgi:hypothetical protein